jgi:hypothetical protein
VGIRNRETYASLRTVEDLARLRRKGTLCSNPSTYVTRATGCTAIINFLGYNFHVVAERKPQATESAIIDQR